MKVTIGEKVYDWDGDYTFPEIVAIEKVLGESFLDYLERMTPEKQGSFKAKPRMTDMGVLLWTVVKRTDPGLKFEDFRFPLDQWSFAGDGADPTSAAGTLSSGNDSDTSAPSPVSSQSDLGNGTA